MIGLSESQRDLKLNAGLFSPLSMNKTNSNKITEMSRPSALTNSDKQQNSNISLMSKVRNAFKQKISNAESDDDCNVDENIAREIP